MRIPRFLSLVGIALGWLSGQCFASPAHVIVYKNAVLDARGRTTGFQGPPASVLQGFGFGTVSDLAAVTSFDGPAAGATGILRALAAAGFDARLAPEFDVIPLYGHDLDADSGAATPPYPPDEYMPTSVLGIYIITFRGPVAPEWRQTVQDLGGTILDPLPPASLLVWLPRAMVPTLVATLPSVRSAIPVVPAMKVAGLDSYPPESAYRPVMVEFYREAGSPDLAALIEALATPGTFYNQDKDNDRQRVQGALADQDIRNLSFNEHVYAISPLPQGSPSAERQAQMVAQPQINPTTGLISLPTTNASGGYAYYDDWLISKGLGNFVAQTVGIIDTGFDNADITFAGIHPDFKNASRAFVVSLDTGLFPPQFPVNDYHDAYTHGTVTASIVAGYNAQALLHYDTGHYRYAEGVCPGCQIDIFKYFECGNQSSLLGLSYALDEVMQKGPPPAKIVNLSFNNDVCNMYDVDAQTVDRHTRTMAGLVTIAAGNVNEGHLSCSTVRAPGTAKNGLTVGMTAGFPSADDSVDVTTGTCGYNTMPPTACMDGRNIDWDSAGNAGFPNTNLKPDVVAPGLRITGPESRDGGGEGGTTWCTTAGVFCLTATHHLHDYGNLLRYNFSVGTSWSAPVAAGAAAVVRQWYQNIRGSAIPSPALLKGMILNGALDLANGSTPPHIIKTTNCTSYGTFGHIPDSRQGWGMVSFDHLLGAVGSYYFADEGPVLTPTSPTWNATVTVVDPTKMTKITLVWTDPDINLIRTPVGTVLNDLNLNAVATLQGSSITWYGNNFGTPSTGITAQSPPAPVFHDPYRNVEEIVIPANTFTAGNTVTLTVTAATLNGDGVNPLANPQLQRQTFAVFGYNIH
jgi:Subtilase family